VSRSGGTFHTIPALSPALLTNSTKVDPSKDPTTKVQSTYPAKPTSVARTRKDTMQKKCGKFLADWRDATGTRRRKAFETAREAKEHQAKMRLQAQLTNPKQRRAPSRGPLSNTSKPTSKIPTRVPRSRPSSPNSVAKAPRVSPPKVSPRSRRSGRTTRSTLAPPTPNAFADFSAGSKKSAKPRSPSPAPSAASTNLSREQLLQRMMNADDSSTPRLLQ